MKYLVNGALFLAMLALPDIGGQAPIDWKAELQKTETQQAIADYIQQNCRVQPQWNGKDFSASASGVIACNVYTKPDEAEICEECLNIQEDSFPFCLSGKTSWEPRSDGLCYLRDEQYKEQADD